MALLYNNLKEGKGVYKSEKKFGFKNALIVYLSHFKDLISVNLTFVLFLLPYLAVSAFLFAAVLPDYHFIVNIKANFVGQIFLVALPFAFVGPLLTAICKVTRNIGTEEHVFPFEDFVAALKVHPLRSIFFSVLAYIYYIAAGFAFVFYYGEWLLFGVVVFTTLLLALMLRYSFLMIVSVDLNVFKILKNSFLLLFAGFKNTLFVLLFIVINALICVFYALLVLNNTLFLIFFGLLLVLLQFSTQFYFQNYFAFNSIITKVVDPYYESLEEDNAADLGGVDISAKDKYAEGDVDSGYIYKDGKLIKKEIAETESLFKDE